MITVVVDIKQCEICERHAAVVYCNGCRKPLCADCRQFDLYAHGCGSVDTLALCYICYDDIDVNPWGGKRPD